MEDKRTETVPIELTIDEHCHQATPYQQVTILSRKEPYEKRYLPFDEFNAEGWRIIEPITWVKSEYFESIARGFATRTVYE